MTLSPEASVHPALHLQGQKGVPGRVTVWGEDRGWGLGLSAFQHPWSQASWEAGHPTSEGLAKHQEMLQAGQRPREGRPPPVPLWEPLPPRTPSCPDMPQRPERLALTLQGRSGRTSGRRAPGER